MVKGKITNLLLACVMGVSIVAAVDSSTYAKVQLINVNKKLKKY